MSDIAIPHTDLVNYLPHRGPNLIPDMVWLAADLQTARSRTEIQLDDPRGRECFIRRDSSGAAYWNEPFLGELVALTGVPMLTEGLNKEGKVAVFSAISKAEAPIPAPFHAVIEGAAAITRQRSGFAQFNATLSINGTVVYRAEVMSGSAKMADILGGARNPGELPPMEALPAWSWKPAAMRFIDGVISRSDTAIQCGYRYPEDHPFVPGHFPDGPLMMGVTQWMAMGDALSCLLLSKGVADGIYVGQGTMTRPDGSEVVSARDLEVQIENGIPRLCGARRIMFREVVRPGDCLLVDASYEG